MILSAVVALGWLWVATTLILVSTRIRKLDAQSDSDLPSLSVVVAARDEQATLSAALQSLLRLDYPDLEIVLVNDRSQDATGDLMESLTAGDPRVRVVHLSELPEGWLGKTHAMHRGAALARGDWLLFTDADVHFQPDCLRRAVSLARRAAVDHLVVGPRIVCHSFWEKVFVGFFSTAFCFRYRPDRVEHDPKRFMGVGGFNLLRRTVYRRLGGHSALALDVLDDMHLGKLVKSCGYRQLFVIGDRAVSVRWVEGLRGVVLGLEKNAFAGLEYSPVLTLVASIWTAVACTAPIWMAGLGHPGWALLSWAAMLACSYSNAVGLGYPRWAGLFYPLAGPLLSWVMLRSAGLCLGRGGIRWRGTFYPLAELRQARPAGG